MNSRAKRPSNRDLRTAAFPSDAFPGKQLSSELYLGYEFGLTSASQTVKLVYQLTRTIQAIARVGSQSSGGEIKYVIRFD